MGKVSSKWNSEKFHHYQSEARFNHSGFWLKRLKGKPNGFQIVFLNWKHLIFSQFCFALLVNITVELFKPFEENASWIESWDSTRPSRLPKIERLIYLHWVLRLRCKLEIMKGLDRDYKFICWLSWHQKISCEQIRQIILKLAPIIAPRAKYRSHPTL